MADLTVPQNDYGYYLGFTVKDSDGVAYPLTGYTITLKVWGTRTKDRILSGTCTPVIAASGTCRYLVTSTDFTKVGSYAAELELTKANVVESTESFSIEVESSK